MTSTIRALLLLILSCSIHLSTIAQTSINNEEFASIVSIRSSGGKIVYNGKSHAFTLDIMGKKIAEQQAEGRSVNQTYLMIDNIIIQSSVVSMPQPLPASFKLNNLSTDQQREILTGYMNYELDYLKNEAGLSLTGLKKEWLIVGTRHYLIWQYSTTTTAVVNNKRQVLPGQIYISTPCFNQVLTVNSPLINSNEKAKQIAMIKRIALSLKTFDKRI